MNIKELNSLKNRILENISIPKKQDSRTILFERMDLQEIDWDEEFSDVTSRKCVDPKQFAEHLNQILSNEKNKVKLNTPWVNKRSIPTDDEGLADVEAFINKITEIPNQILVTSNAKMEKSVDGEKYNVTIGLPAFIGLVYDIENKKFNYISTCPGAGSCVTACYALKGNFLNDGKSIKLTRALNLLLNDPEMFKSKVKNEIVEILHANRGKTMSFRWNEAGDFFANKYFNIAQEITQELTEKGYDFESYAYTKMGDLMNLKDRNVVLNFSDDANKRETGKIEDMDNTKNSKIVPRNVFKDLLFPIGSSFKKDEKGKIIFREPTGKEELKNRISKTYGIPKETLLSYDELLQTPKGAENQYDVIVTPSDGDISAERNDVRTTYLLQH